MRDGSEDSNRKAIYELLGLSYWRRHWWFPAGMLTLPIPLTVGLITGSYPFDRSEIAPTSQMIVGFSSLLSAAWTFGFAYFWPSTEREARKMRMILMKTKPLPQGANMLDALNGLRMPFWTFLLAIAGLILMIWSAFLAVGAALYSFGPFILVSLWSLTFGSMIMIGTWTQLYLLRDTLGRITELVPLDASDQASH